jgi:hypothetical protein
MTVDIVSLEKRKALTFFAGHIQDFCLIDLTNALAPVFVLSIIHSTRRQRKALKSRCGSGEHKI